jgi:hypothetical protein
MPADIAPDLLAAYLATRYHVRHGGGFDFYIERRSADLLALHAEQRVDGSAFITAWNPESEGTPREENEARNARLLRDIEALGLRALPAEGIGPTGWREESFLVPGISRDDAVALARKYRQNAIVWAAADGVPRLEITR